MSYAARSTQPVNPPRWRETLGEWTPRLVLAPSAIASFVYVIGFTLWTFYISLSNSTELPTYGFVGFKHYGELWANERWQIAYKNVFFFSVFYVIAAIAVGLALAIAIDQRVRFESFWRTIFLYPLAVSFAVTGTVWRWLYAPTGIEAFLHYLGWADASFRLTADRNYAIYSIIITGVWQSSGFAMALFLAGLRSVDPDFVKAAQIDGASTARIYRKSDPALDRADLRRRHGGDAAIRHQDVRPGHRADQRRPGRDDHLPRQLCLRPDVPARADGDRLRRLDDDARGARRRAGALCAVADLAQRAGRRPRMSEAVLAAPTFDAEARRASSRHAAGRIGVYGFLSVFALIYLRRSSSCSSTRSATGRRSRRTASSPSRRAFR